MQKFAFFLYFIMLPFLIYSQEDTEVLSKKELKALNKEKRIAEKEEEAIKQKEITRHMVENHRFVLEADYISGNGGSRSPVSSNLNFIAIDSLEGTLQIGSNWGMGSNGVGGVTVDGRIGKYELYIKESKKGVSYSITILLVSVLGSYDIQLWISQSGSASATVRGNTSGSLSYSGNLVPIGLSRVYKGHAFP